MLSFYQIWLPYIYLYGAGGILFLTGVGLVIRHRALDLNRQRHRKWFNILFIGFIWYALIHAVIILAAIKG